MFLKDLQQAKLILTAITIAELEDNKVLSIDIRKFLKKLNTVLLNTHIYILYDGFKKKEVKVLVHLCIKIFHLNNYLY